MIRIIQFHDLREFAQRAQPMLIRSECENCWPLGTIGANTPANESTRLMSIERDGEVIGAAVQTAPIALGITRVPEEAIEPLVDELLNLGWGGLGFTGPIPSVDHLADQWCARTGQTKQLHLGLRVFQLTSVTHPAQVPGKMAVSDWSRIEVLTHFQDEFCRSIGEIDPEPGKITRKLIDERRTFAWEDDGQIRSMACIAGPTPNGMRINRVYTPPEFRGRGYASNLVAALSQHLLDGGRKFCFLFTDLANPTSNKIYQQIGYQPVSDFRHWEVKGKPTG